MYESSHTQYCCVHNNFLDLNKLNIWLGSLNHPGLGMIRKLLAILLVTTYQVTNFPKSSDFMCTACALGEISFKALSP